MPWKKADGTAAGRAPGARKEGGTANVTGTSHGRWLAGSFNRTRPGRRTGPPSLPQRAREVPCLPPSALGGWRIGRARGGGKSGSAGVNEERRRWGGIFLVRRSVRETGPLGSRLARRGGS